MGAGRQQFYLLCLLPAAILGFGTLDGQNTLAQQVERLRQLAPVHMVDPYAPVVNNSVVIYLHPNFPQDEGRTP